MQELTYDEMAEIQGGSIDCAVAGAGFFLSAVGIGVATAIGPYGWLMGAYLVTNVSLSYYSFVKACSQS